MRIGLASYRCENKNTEFNIGQIERAMREAQGKVELLCFGEAFLQGFDFLLGSVHFAGDFAFDHTAEHWEGLDVDEIFRTYFEDSLSLAKSGLFTGIGHPDHLKLFGHRPSFSLVEYYEKLACELEKAGMYADQNSGAFRRCPETGELGMNPELLRALVRHNVRIVTSSDAHRPEDVGFMIRELGEAVAEAGGGKLCN